MPRKILVEFTFDWEDYDDVDDEFLMEEAFTINPLTSLEGGISAKIIQQPSSSGVESAGVWVNCNVRLPNIEDHFDDPPKYILKCGNDGWRGDRDVYYQDAASIREICKNYDYCEWLDESAAVLPSNSRCAALYLKAIQDFELPDIDAPVFTHTQQFRQLEEFRSWIKFQQQVIMGEEMLHGKKERIRSRAAAYREVSERFNQLFPNH